MKPIVSNNNFGYWIQTLADIQFLNLELSGICDNYEIDALKKTVSFTGKPNFSEIKKRIAHLDRVNGEQTLYSKITDLYNDTNAYAFHNLYPYKGKFYPRIVRTLLNTFKANKQHIVLDPFNGCGTTTHECSLIGIHSIGVDINPIGNIVSTVKNELLYSLDELNSFSTEQVRECFNFLADKKHFETSKILKQLFLLLYIDTIDAFDRTTRYKKKGKLGLFMDKFDYIKDCGNKLKNFLSENNLVFNKAAIKEGNAIDLKKIGIKNDSIDYIITSPPYYFSLDYVGKDKIAYDYLNETKFFAYDMDNVKNEYLGMKIRKGILEKRKIEKKVVTYFMDLEKSIYEIVRVTKKKGKIAIIIGDSSLNGIRLPTTQKTHEYCMKNGLKHIKTIFNPLLGTRNRAIRGESVLLYEK